MSKLFPRRNRIISGLGLGLIIVEAAEKSGSLITARMALDQGREIFAVPGSPLDPRYTGTNDLIRQGAVLTESARDVLNHIHAMPQRLAETSDQEFGAMPTQISDSDMEHAHVKILENLGFSPVPVDDLIRQSNIPAAVVFTVLLELELAGRLERQVGNKVALVG